MTQTIRRELLIPQPRDRVWQAIANSASLAEWMYPNDFEPRVGHQFTFQVPANPKAKFDGLEVRCEVLECEPPSHLVFSWSVGGPVVNTRVSFRLEPEGDATRVFFEHSGFDLSQPHGKQALGGAEFGWTRMLDQLSTLVEGLETNPTAPLAAKTENMSTPRFSSVEDYLASHDPVKADTLKSIIDFVLAEFPELECKIAWNVPNIHRNGKYVVGLAAYKRHLTLAPWSTDVLEEFKGKGRLEGFVVFKNCFQIPVDWELDKELVKDLVQARLDELN